jgi:hypothetical protein
VVKSGFYSKSAGIFRAKTYVASLVLHHRGFDGQPPPEIYKL